MRVARPLLVGGRWEQAYPRSLSIAAAIDDACIFGRGQYAPLAHIIGGYLQVDAEVRLTMDHARDPFPTAQVAHEIHLNKLLSLTDGLFWVCLFGNEPMSTLRRLADGGSAFEAHANGFALCDAVLCRGGRRNTGGIISVTERDSNGADLTLMRACSTPKRKIRVVTVLSWHVEPIVPHPDSPFLATCVNLGSRNLQVSVHGACETIDEYRMLCGVEVPNALERARPVEVSPGRYIVWALTAEDELQVVHSAHVTNAGTLELTELRPFCAEHELIVEGTTALTFAMLQSWLIEWRGGVLILSVRTGLHYMRFHETTFEVFRFEMEIPVFLRDAVLFDDRLFLLCLDGNYCHEFQLPSGGLPPSARRPTPHAQPCSCPINHSRKRHKS
jgi:hypothetical protein